MLREIINILRTEDAPLSVDILSQRLDVDKSAVEGMLAMLQKKGMIKMDDMGETNGSGCQGFSCSGCATAQGCPFVGKMPRRYTLEDSN